MGEEFSYLYFWGHRPRPDGAPSSSCFSQWYEAPFQLDGVSYSTAEHYMMAEKARLFGDSAALGRILAATSPGAAKTSGRQVIGFNDPTWNSHRFEIVVQGNFAKFNQNPRLAEFLRRTGDKVLVEASPVDSIWGIGLAADDPQASDPGSWQGLNLLGFALMIVRERLASRAA
ncbi:MAG: NADAR family protein [Ottowia sp.]|uniref:NADAR family protein n=1 Tax=Ottowia sp. TaxID=1898956 RepID=UPI0039E717F2